MSKIPNFGSSAKNSEIINKRRVINGEDDGLMQVSPLKHPFANMIFQKQLANTWMPQEVTMAKDVSQWQDDHTLTEQERRVYKRTLSFLSNLDGIQTENLTHNIARQITSPEIKLSIIRQAFEEALHVHSYSTMIEALGLDPEEIYGMYRQDEELYRRNKYILDSFGKIDDANFKTGTKEADQTFFLALIANIILEGVYFYAGFMNFYVFKRNNKMPGSAEMIQFINRDENLHLSLFIHIVNTVKEEQPEIWSAETQAIAQKMIEDAVALEIGWGKSCIGEGILGLNPDNLAEYLHFVGNSRLKSIGLKPAWPGATNPFPWVDEMTQGQMTEVNFFEGKVREYASGTLEW